MSLRVLRPLLTVLVFVPIILAQTTPFTMTGPATLGPAPNSTFNFTGSGAVTMTPGGPAQLKMDVFPTGDDICNRNIEAAITITIANGDRLDLTLFIPLAQGEKVSGTFVITGGTGQYAGKGGSGTGTIALLTPPSSLDLTVTLTGTITAQPIVTPSINPSGVVPLGHSRVMIQPGSWISIYGKNLASGTTIWDGLSSDIPTTLGGLTATINGKPAFFWFTSPGQVNLQAPDDSLRGCTTVTLTTPNGPVSAQVQINQAAPSLSLLDAKYPAAVILTPNGGGAYGGGTYDLAGPTNRFTYSTRPVKKGENLVLYGVGFGPTNPAVPAGKVFSGSARVQQGFPVQVLINNNVVNAAYVGLIGAGLYQINITVPANLPVGDNALQVITPGAGGQTQDNIFLSVQ